MQYFSKIITWFGGLSPKSRLILIYQPFVIKQQSMMIFLFLKVRILERSSPRRSSLEKAVLLTISQNSQENTCARVSFLNFIKKRHCTGIFWWILEFLRTPFLRTHRTNASNWENKKMFGSRSCCLEVFWRKAALTNFVKFTGKVLCQGFFFYKVEAGVFLGTLQNF